MRERPVFTLVRKIALDKAKGNLLKSPNDFRSKHLPATDQRQRPASAAIGFATTSFALNPWPMRPPSTPRGTRGTTEQKQIRSTWTHSSSNDRLSLQHDRSDAIMHSKSHTFCAALFRKRLRREPPPLAL
ncbi:hypothetical protein PMI40_00788 [Herbaspirillum sp. YR522]|nr:hypothetical protein PMI40_00788 [Herbaspirillum sp. YR522]